jgi:phage gp46-like protein
MTVGIDACLKQIAGDLFDLDIGVDGDILSVDFFDSAIIVSLFAERRANESEVAVSRLRRGWIGNESTPDFEIGSKIWLFEQSRLTITVLNGIIIAARDALQWLVDDGFATAIKSVEAVITPNGINLEVVINRPNSEVDRRFFTLWDNTAIPCPDIPNNITLTIPVSSVGPTINIFELAGKPSNAVDVVVNYSSSIVPVAAVAMSTGGPWHPDTTILISGNTINSIIFGGGGKGGDGGGDLGDGSIGGGGGGGATFGVGGGSDDGAHDGLVGGLFSGGLGSIGAVSGATSTHGATNGNNGFAALELFHDVTIINRGIISGGAGGGGGGGEDVGTGGNGAGALGDGLGTDGAGTSPGLGGGRGPSIIKNGNDVFFALMGLIIGDII